MRRKKLMVQIWKGDRNIRTTACMTGTHEEDQKAETAAGVSVDVEAEGREIEEISVEVRSTVQAMKSECAHFDKQWLKHRFLWFLLSTALASQQSLVLLPLTSMEITPYCYQLQDDLPVSSRKAACWHKWSIAGIPYGVPAILVGSLMIVIFGSMERKNDKNSLVGLFVLVGVVLLLTGIGLFVFWLFGGIFIGVWFTFSSYKVLVDLALTKIFAPILIIFSADVVLRYARVPTSYPWFRVPLRIIEVKMRVFEFKARFDASVSSAVRKVRVRYLPFTLWFEGGSESVHEMSEEEIKDSLERLKPKEKERKTKKSEQNGPKTSRN